MRNQTIKFRAWDGLNKKFTYWTMNDLCTYCEKDEKPSALEDWCQSTGLLDSKGKEIYEGDVVKCANSSQGVLVWNQKRAGYLLDTTQTKDGWTHPIDGFNIETAEIIGNIYESPELLTK